MIMYCVILLLVRGALSNESVSPLMHIDQMARPLQANTSVISVFCGRGASLAFGYIEEEGLTMNVLAVVELERREKIRNFHGTKEYESVEEMEAAWLRALGEVQRLASQLGVTLGATFDVGIYVKQGNETRLPAVMRDSALDWYSVEHQWAHVVLADSTSGMRRPLVILIDEMENEQQLHIFAWGLPYDARLRYNLHEPVFNTMVGGLAVGQPLVLPRTNWSTVNPMNVFKSVVQETYGKCASWKTSRDWSLEVNCSRRSPLEIDRDFYDDFIQFNTIASPANRDYSRMKDIFIEAFADDSYAIDFSLLDPRGKWDETAFLRKTASAVQEAWETVLISIIRCAIEYVKQERNAPAPFGIAIVGAGALSTRTNSAVARKLKTEVFVPFAPTEAGLSVGALFMAADICKARPTNLAFAGSYLFDLDQVPALAAARGGVVFDESFTQCDAIDNCTNPEPFLLTTTLAEALAHGQLIAIARGRAEHGPRSRGHRTVFANPYNATALARLRRLEEQAPISLAALHDVNIFDSGDQWKSPYLAPSLRSDMCQCIPSVCEIDSVVQVEAVHPLFDVFTAQLLQDFQSFVDSAPILAITALLNTRRIGTMVNTAHDALSFFCSEPDLDALVLEDTLFFDKRGTCNNF